MLNKKKQNKLELIFFLKTGGAQIRGGALIRGKTVTNSIT